MTTPPTPYDNAPDAAERRPLEENLRESEERYASLVDILPGAVYRCANDALWTMSFVSKQIEDITGYPPSDFIGNVVRSYQSVIHPADRFRVDETVAAGVEAHEPFEVEYRIVDARGAVKHLYEKGRAVYDADGTVRWLDGVIVDHTEHRRAEMAERNAERLDLVRELATGIAHNFNNLLSGIRGYADLVRHEMEARDQSTEDIATIVDICDRAARLAGQVRLVAETDYDVYTTIDLGEVVELCLAQRAEELPEAIKLETELTSAQLYVRAAEDKLEMVLRHLCDNAVDAMPDGGTITVRLEPEERPTEAGPRPYAALSITDTGVGMNPRTAANAFAPFSSTKQTVGVGLSLAVVHGIVETHGGTIELKTAPGRGATFRILLPMVKPPK